MKPVRLMTATALSALCLGLGSLPAAAFDDVTWNWDGTVTSSVSVSAFVIPSITVEGLAQVEIEQWFDGDATATATLGSFENTPAPTIEVIAGPDEVVVVEGPADATYDLPAIEVSATAVGNNTSITADVAVLLDISQDADGGNLADGPDDLTEISATVDGGDVNDGSIAASATAVGNNLSVDTSSDLLIANIFQDLEGNVSATGNIGAVIIGDDEFGYVNLNNIDGATVDLSATAVGNNVSINVGEPDIE